MENQSERPFFETLSVVHKTPTRLRIRPLRKLSRELFSHYEGLFDRLLPDHEFVVSDYTQSFLITHENEASGIIHRIAEHIPVIDETLLRGQRVRIAKLREELQDQIQKVDLKIMEYTEGELDLKSVTALALLGMGYFQTFGRKKFLPAGETLFAAGMKFLLKG